MKTIFLTGFMGSGKTTIGKDLSKYLQIPVIDSDEEIERRTESTIRTIFEKDGEDYFRSLETKILLSLPLKDVIVTTGGGIIKKEENRKWMLEHGMVVYLHCDFSVLWERLQIDTTRPLVVSKAQTEELYETRMPLYMEHHLMIDTSFKNVKEVVTEIAEKIKSSTN